jgi:hypothetical protein
MTLPFLLIALLAAALLAAPAAQAQTDLVNNGGLDSFDGSGLASGWSRWWEETPNPNTGSLDYAGKPDWSPESNPALTLGGQSQHIGTTWNPWHAGIYQVLTAAPGAQIHIIASGRAFASNDNFPTPSDPADSARMQIGADPDGGTDWWAGGIQWSGQANPLDTWQTFSLDVTAGPGGKVTLFLAASFRGNSRLHQDIWWDNVSAQVTGTAPTAAPTSAPPPTSGPAPTAAPATAAPAATSSPVPASPAPALTALPPTAEAPTAAATADTRPGTACIGVFEDGNGNGTKDGTETDLAGSRVGLDGADSPAPHCFDGLAPGAHSLAATLPAGYFATTGDTVKFTLAPGQKLDLLVGAQSSRPVQTAEAATSAPGSAGADSTVLIGVGLVVAALLAVGGAAAFLFLRSRR